MGHTEGLIKVFPGDTIHIFASMILMVLFTLQPNCAFTNSRIVDELGAK